MAEKETNNTDTQSKAELTEVISSLSEGDTIHINDREAVYTILDTNTYSVTAQDEYGTRVTISQNLQTGGWVITETVYRVETNLSR